MLFSLVCRRKTKTKGGRAGEPEQDNSISTRGVSLSRTREQRETSLPTKKTRRTRWESGDKPTRNSRTTAAREPPRKASFTRIGVCMFVCEAWAFLRYHGIHRVDGWVVKTGLGMLLLCREKPNSKRSSCQFVIGTRPLSSGR